MKPPHLIQVTGLDELNYALGLAGSAPTIPAKIVEHRDNTFVIELRADTTSPIDKFALQSLVDALARNRKRFPQPVTRLVPPVTAPVERLAHAEAGL